MDYNNNNNINSANRRYIPSYRGRSPSPRRGRTPPSPSRRHFRSPSPRWGADTYTPGGRRNWSPPRVGGDSYVPPSAGGNGGVSGAIGPGNGPRRRLRSRSPMRRSRSPPPPHPRYRPRSRSADRRRRFSRSRSPRYRHMRSRSPHGMRRPRSPFRRSRSPPPFARRRPSMSPGRRPKSPPPSSRRPSPRAQSHSNPGDGKNLQPKSPERSKPDSRRSSPPPVRSALPNSSAASPSPRPSIAPPSHLPSRPLSPHRDQTSKPGTPGLPVPSYRRASSPEKAVLVGTHSTRSPVTPANQPSPQANAPSPQSRHPQPPPPPPPQLHRQPSPPVLMRQRSPPRGPAASRGSPMSVVRSYGASPVPMRTASPLSSSHASGANLASGGSNASLKNNSPIGHRFDNGSATQSPRPRSPPYNRAVAMDASAAPTTHSAPAHIPSQPRNHPGSGPPLTAPRGPASQNLPSRDNYGRPGVIPNHQIRPGGQQVSHGSQATSVALRQPPSGPIPTQPRAAAPPPTGPRNMMQGGIPTGPRSGGHPYRQGFNSMLNHQTSPMMINGGPGGAVLPGANHSTHGTHGTHGAHGTHGTHNPHGTHSVSSPTQYRPSVPNLGIAGGPQLIPGGRLLPPISVEISERLSRLKVDQMKLEEEHRAIQEKKRKSLREWDKMERELASHTYRVELAEKQLVEMSAFGI